MSSLPIEEILPELRARFAAHRGVVLQAPPGAGKTTRVPLALLDETWLAGKSILILEPRRLAARAAAARMAAQLGEEIGVTVGYRIRFETRVSRRTRIEVLTEGILTRRLQSDAALEGVGLVIFDEFHERHLHADLALALTLDSQHVLRQDLRVLVMSATLDGAAVAAMLDDAPVVTGHGRLFPVGIRYAARDLQEPIASQIAQAVNGALAHHEGDILVFLPGAREIRRTQELLEGRVDVGEVAICPLYGDLPWELQDQAIRPGAAGGRRKVVLATPIAETSLTIEGVRVVVDSGYVRVPQFDPRSGLTRLVTQRVSRASADQRAGRAGRVAPGVCYRLWTETVQRGLVPQATPEICTADLGPLALELAAWGARDARTLAWLDPPPPAALAQARALLGRLEAVDETGGITEAGRAMARLPLHPRLAHMLLRAGETGHGAIACDIAALLSERDILVGERRHSCDLSARLEALQAFRARGREGAQSHGADPGACARAEQAARQWRGLIHVEAQAVAHADETVGLLLAFAYPDRVGLQRAPGTPRYLLASGRGARLPENEMRLRQPCVVAASLDAGVAEAMIYLAAPISIATLTRELGSQLRTEELIRWDPVQEAVVARRERRLGQLVLETAPLADADRDRMRAATLAGVRAIGLQALPWTPDARQWQARVLSLRHWFPEEHWPDVSDAALTAALERWLTPSMDGVTRREHFGRIDLLGALRRLLNWQQSRRLQEGAPTHLTVPSGSRMRLEYRPGEAPVLAVKLQEMFGLADTPRVAWGQIPVTLHLLSPARRPIQVTQDLRGFWERTYAEVRRELKGRYPRHPWPDDPWRAQPTARTKRKPG